MIDRTSVEFERSRWAHEVRGKIGLFECMTFRMGCGGKCKVWWAVDMLCMIQTEMTSAFERWRRLGRSFWFADEEVAIYRCAPHNVR